MTVNNRARLRIWGVAFIPLVLFSGCAASSPIMTQVSRVDVVDSERALVTFIRPQISSVFRSIDWTSEGHTYLDVWDGEKLIGILVARCYIQYEAEPGEHLFLVGHAYTGDPVFAFFGMQKKWYYVSANLQKGKHYCILASRWTSRTAVDPVHRDDTRTRGRVETWLTRLKPTAAIPEKADQYANSRISEVRQAIAEFKSGVRYEVLNSDDGQ